MSTVNEKVHAMSYQLFIYYFINLFSRKLSNQGIEITVET
jgi:hypothetical protein